ncbi:hypothetical protein JB92DRAFT_2902348 [Gautieria morchelliformis]|nr:hypothetical protein JB92DRAFT_2902348 [Gautieria morchelliformis]
MRFMFGTRAYIVFTLDKLCAAICKQVQAVVQDFRCHELMCMLEQQRARDTDVLGSRIASQDVIRYRRQAEALVGSDENLFRIDWLTDTKCLRIQLLDVDDLSLDPPPTCKEAGLLVKSPSGAEAINSRMTRRWKQYVLSYVLSYPTEGLRIGVGRKTFLKKTLLDEYADEVADTRWKTDAHPGVGEVGLEVMVGPGTCKLYFASGSEEAAWRIREVGSQKNNNYSVGAGGEEANGDVGTGTARRRERKPRRRRSSPDEEEEQEREREEEDSGEWERLKERAEARLREQKRWIIQFDQGLLF